MLSDKKIVVIGGGTGLSTILKGLKLHTHNITAVVTVADDGGSSGALRGELGMLPPGDVRNCISALAEIDGETAEILNFRFKEGSLKGHTLGNIILAAFNEMSASFDEAVRRFSAVAGVIGAVYPVTNESVQLAARLKNGDIIEGESHIGFHRSGPGSGIEHVFLKPEKPKAVKGVINAIKEADAVVLGPGSLYTSIIPNLLVDGVAEAVKESNAIKIYVCNIMSQAGETEGYTVSDHLEAIEKHSYRGIADAIIINDAPIPEGIRERYAAENACEVKADIAAIEDRCAVVKGNLLLVQNEKIRHNFSRLARTVMKLTER